MNFITKDELEKKDIVSKFELNDGNHRLEAYNRLGINEYFVIFWITEKEDYADFMEKYKQYLD